MSHARTQKMTRITLKITTVVILLLMLLSEILFSTLSHFFKSMITVIVTYPYSVIYNNLMFFLFGLRGKIGGLTLTILVAAVSLLLAFIAGIIFGLMRNSKRWWLSYPAIGYIELVRSVPLILVIFWFCFFPPGLSETLRSVVRVYYGILALIAFTGAYIAEIVRAGILSVSKGQMEASRSSGLTHTQSMIYIILPQALKNMIPSLVNQFVSLIKDTSLLWFVGVMEFTSTIFATSNREVNTTVTMGLYFFAAVVYFLVCYPLTASSRKLEKKLGVGER
jgi:polar amino acid transport system permease protein